MWGQDLELMAQLVEEVSVLAADHRRKKPRTIPRPKTLTAGRKVNGHQAMLAAVKRRQDQVRYAGDSRG